MKKIYVFCNNCAMHDWHSAIAISEDGYALAGHSCSNHGWIPHDMGVTSDWKHEIYREHFPEGFEVEYVEQDQVKTHPGISAAYALNLARGENAPLV